MTVVSLFAGIGGFDLGFERAGFDIVAHVEKDANCRKLLAAKWPDAVVLDDVRTAGKHNLPSCDVVTFGFPCQDLSSAGKRAGMKGERSCLFYEATRIINELKPAWCLFENVPGLLSSDNGRDFARVLMEMDKIGYCGAWRTLDAQWFGVAQRRRRVFGLFTRLGSGAERCAEVLSIPESLRGHPAPSREAGEGVVRTIESRTQGGGFPGTDGACVGHVVAIRTAQTSSNGWGINTEGTAYTLDGTTQAVAHTLRGEGFDASEDGTGRGTPIVPTIVNALTDRPDRGGGNSEGQRLLPVVANCLQERDAKGADSDTKPGHLIPPGMAVRRLTPTECERLQGFPDGWTAGFSDSTRYRMLGNAVCVNVAEWVARRMNQPREAAAAAKHAQAGGEDER
jgi:DNA (cytosine-5)-methyltransferase 1